MERFKATVAFAVSILHRGMLLLLLLLLLLMTLLLLAMVSLLLLLPVSSGEASIL